MRFLKRYLTTKDQDVYSTVKWVKTNSEILGRDGSVVFVLKDVEFPENWSQTAINITASKYFRDGGGVKEVSLRQLIDRIVDTIVSMGIESGKNGDNYFVNEENMSIFRDELKYIFLSQMAALNSPAWFNLGVQEHPQSSACFINSVEDNMESILELSKTEAMLFKYGSGTGTNFSTLRSSKEKLSSGGYSSGPVSFMKGFDAFAGIIKSGGKTRRAAKMIILNDFHPDILEFIRSKSKEEKKAKDLILLGYDGGMDGDAYSSVFFQNGNHSVRVTNDFMQAVVNDESWALRDRHGNPMEMIQARDLFDEISKAAWECGDPGIQFDTITNIWHTCKASGRINASNPCVTGDTKIATENGWKRIDEMLEGDWNIYGSDGKLHQVNSAFRTGRRRVLQFKFENGIELKVTPEHKVSKYEYTDYESGNGIEGDVRADELKIGDFVCSWLSNENESGNLDMYVGVDKVVEINELLDIVDVYDITEPNTHHFVANGIVVHNCGEFCYLDDTACNLSSLNLLKFIDHNGVFDFKKFEHVINILILAQEILVGNSSYPTEKIKKNSIDFRPLGLGYSNLGSLLMTMGLPYDSDKGRYVAACITAIMTGAAYRTSSDIANQVGSFNRFKENKESMLEVINKHKSSLNQLSDKNGTLQDYEYLYTEANKIWEKVAEREKFRNGQVTVIAPTGTISFMMDCDTTGIEPELGLIKFKSLVGGGSIKLVNRIVPQALAKLKYSEDKIKAIIEYIEKNEMIEGAPHLKKMHLPVFDCSLKSQKGKRFIAPMGHVNMMASVQPFLSGAISKTVNMPGDSTVEDIGHVYMEAWKRGLKSIALYRDGCKSVQPLNMGSDHDRKVTNESGDVVVLRSERRHLPVERKSITHKFTIGGHDGYATVGLYDDNTPGELFITMSKQGTPLSGLLDGFATANSLLLQYGVPVKVLIEKFSRTIFEPSGWTANDKIGHASSIYDYIFRWLDIKFDDNGVLRDNWDKKEENGNGKKGEVEKGDGVGGVVEKIDKEKEGDGEKSVDKIDGVMIGGGDQDDGKSDGASDGFCFTCGGVMVRSGSCKVCSVCGTSGGCS